MGRQTEMMPTSSSTLSQMPELTVVSKVGDELLRIFILKRSRVLEEWSRVLTGYIVPPQFASQRHPDDAADRCTKVKAPQSALGPVEPLKDERRFHTNFPRER